MRRILVDLLHGTILAAIAAGISCLLALVGYSRPYYLAIFLPVFMLGYILIAWLLYLRGDRFMGSPSAMRGGARKAGGDADRLPEILPREGAGANAGEDSGDLLPRPKRALLWAAGELGIAASLLYSIWGIGAVYHI